MYTGHSLADICTDIYTYAQFSIETPFPLASRKLQCMLKSALLIWGNSGTACLHALINNCTCTKKISWTLLSLVRPRICTDLPTEKEIFQSCCWTKSPWQAARVLLLGRSPGVGPSLRATALITSCSENKNVGNSKLTLSSFPKHKETVSLMSL